MRHYCPTCGKEQEYKYVRTRRGKRGEKIEVYRCPVCHTERRPVVS